MNATTEQIERAKVTASKSVLSFEKCLEMVIKQDAKKGWKPLTKKDIVKMKIRNSETTPSKSHYELLQEGIMKNLPSSLK